MKDKIVILTYRGLIEKVFVDNGEEVEVIQLDYKPEMDKKTAECEGWLLHGEYAMTGIETDNLDNMPDAERDAVREYGGSR